MVMCEVPQVCLLSGHPRLSPNTIRCCFWGSEKETMLSRNFTLKEDKQDRDLVNTPYVFLLEINTSLS